MSKPERTISAAGDYVQDVGTQGAASLASLTDAVTGVVSDWADRAQGFGKSTDQYVRSNPWRTAGMVAIAGLVIGYAVSMATRQTNKRRRRA
jgi:ElaB/YqjD/DUF883 family membrane-anchored ribosome-binding protein